MSAHVLLNLLNELGKRDKMRGLVYRFYCMALFHSQARHHMIKCILHEHYVFQNSLLCVLGWYCMG